jgi:hypothetical protein
MAVGTGEDDPFILPAAHPLAMGTEIPVLLAIGVAGPADEVRLPEFNFLVIRCAQIIDVVAGMAGQAPEPVAAMIDLAHMPRPQPAGFRIDVLFLVATRTIAELQFFIAGLDREVRGFGVELVSGLACISLRGSEDAWHAESDNHPQPSQHILDPCAFSGFLIEVT